MEWNLSKTDQEMIAARTNFKYEDHFGDLSTALDHAIERSKKSLATIYVHERAGLYCVNVYGVLRIGVEEVARFKKGAKL